MTNVGHRSDARGNKGLGSFGITLESNTGGHMKITSKGQVTIPQEIRERYGFLPGTEVHFQDQGDHVRLVKRSDTPRRGARIVAHMRGRADTRLTTNEIMALTRGS